MSQSPSQKRTYPNSLAAAAAEDIPERLRLLEAALEGAGEALAVVDRNGIVLIENSLAADLLGAPVSSRLPAAWFAPDSALPRALRGGESAQIELSPAVPNGPRLRVVVKPVEFRDLAAAVLTLRACPEPAGAPNPRSAWDMVESIALPTLALDSRGRIVRVNRACVALAGCPAERIEGRLAWKVLDVPEDAEKVRRAFGKLRRGTLLERYDCSWVRDDGERLSLRWSSTAVFDAQGALENVVSVGVDVTDCRHVEAALREVNETVAAVIETSPLAIVAMDLEGVVKTWNRAAEKIFGWSAQEVLNRRFLAVPESDLPFFRENLRRVENGVTPSAVERQRLRKDGALVDVQIWNAAWRDASGVVIGAISMIADVTDRKALEEQFRQSQKMEAVGRLAGGVAHDFNNLLTVITGYSHMLLDDVREDENLSGRVEDVLHAAESAAALTSQLLTFSRRQIAQPCAFDINLQVAGMDHMLRRLIGEDLDLEMALAADLPHGKLDPGQFEQVLMNLVVNARDAMPDGGRIAISTQLVRVRDAYSASEPGLPPGDYICLSVADTGAGMDEATRLRIFEPFFTTKGKGKGTGLGLSTAYGIIRQAGGDIWVSSEVGSGSEFRIYLPSAGEAAAAAAGCGEAVAPRQGAETVLLVEDEPGLRRLIGEVLRAKGYEVLESGDPREALRICEQHRGAIHLFLTDQVMPHMSGRELAARAAAMRPGMKVLHMSGYTNTDALFSSAAFLAKPFTPDALLAKVRQALDA